MHSTALQYSTTAVYNIIALHYSSVVSHLIATIWVASGQDPTPGDQWPCSSAQRIFAKQVGQLPPETFFKNS